MEARWRLDATVSAAQKQGLLIARARDVMAFAHKGYLSAVRAVIEVEIAGTRRSGNMKLKLAVTTTAVINVLAY